jgi:hypothetical protein
MRKAILRCLDGKEIEREFLGDETPEYQKIPPNVPKGLHPIYNTERAFRRRPGQAEGAAPIYYDELEPVL